MTLTGAHSCWESTISFETRFCGAGLHKRSSNRIVASFLTSGTVAAMLACGAVAETPAADPGLAQWPRVASAIAQDAVMESRIKPIVAGMSVAQKVGQMTQADISAATPEDVRRYYLGGILNGADSQPFGARFATFEQWRDATRLYHAAALATDMPVKIPLIWGTDAVHGHGIVHGASIFPHNMGLGAAHDAELVREIGAAVGAQGRATGIDWVFAPTLAVVQNYRWGRSYESYSSDPALVREYAASFVSALQGSFASPANAVATAKHFIGDGGTDRGVDRGAAQADRRSGVAPGRLRTDGTEQPRRRDAHGGPDP